MEREQEPSWQDLKVPATGKIATIVWVGLALSVFQQFVGINVIFYYSNILWEAVGFTEDQSFVITRHLGDDQHPDHVDRDRHHRPNRPKTVADHRFGRHDDHPGHDVADLRHGDGGRRHPGPETPPCSAGASANVALVAANLFVVAFGMSWGPVVWVLLGEMFPNRMRAMALSLAAGAQWVANWVVTVSFPTLKDIGLGLAYGLYAAFALLSFFFVLKFIEETKGKQLEDMHA